LALATCGCRESHPSSSGDKSILVDEPPRMSARRSLATATSVIGRVGSMGVVVIDVLDEYGLEVAAAQDQKPMEAL
jgi:hypothetical protein